MMLALAGCDERLIKPFRKGIVEAKCTVVDEGEGSGRGDRFQML